MSDRSQNVFAVLVALALAAGYFFGVLQVHKIWMMPVLPRLDCKPGTHEEIPDPKNPWLGKCVPNPPPDEDAAPAPSPAQ